MSVFESSQDISRGGDGGASCVRAGILLVTFGSSSAEAREVFGNIDRLAVKCFPGYELRWAYTSETIRRKLAAEGKRVDSVGQALAKFAESGVRKVFVQSLHVVPGIEYECLVRQASGAAGAFDVLEVGLPLLSSMADVRETVGVMMSKVPPDRCREDAVLFMGHGSPKHHADLIYVAVAHVLEKSYANAYIASVEGSPVFRDVLEEMKLKGIKKVYLIPFMSVAGDHALNDMGGDEPGSWKSILLASGIEPVPVLQGMATHDEIVNIWLGHLETACKGLTSQARPLTQAGTGKFYGIGVGPGDPELLTVKAASAIKSSDYIFEAASKDGKESVAGKIARHHAAHSAEFIPLVFPMTRQQAVLEKAWEDNAAKIAEKVNSGAVCSFVTIGDPMLYSTCSYILGHLRHSIGSERIEIIPGITSLQVLAAKTMLPLAEGEETVSVFPAFSAHAAERIRLADSDTCVVMKPFKNKDKVVEIARESGYDGVFGSRLCLENENITANISDVKQLPVEYLSIFMLKKTKP